MIKADHFHCRSHHAKLTRKKKTWAQVFKARGCVTEEPFTETG